MWGGGNRRSREQLNVIFGSRRQRDSRSQAVEGVGGGGGGALQQRCRSCSFALIGCFAIRMLRDEGEFTSCRAEDALRGEPGGFPGDRRADRLSDIADLDFPVLLLPQTQTIDGLFGLSSSLLRSLTTIIQKDKPRDNRTNALTTSS